MKSLSTEILERSSAGGLDAVTLTLPYGAREFYLTAHPYDGSPASIFDKLAHSVRENNARIVSQDVFASQDMSREGARSLREAFGEPRWPVAWIESGVGSRRPVLCSQAYAVSGVDVRPLEIDGQVTGSMFETDPARFCLLGNISPSDTSASRPAQALEVFEKIDSALHIAGMDFHDVVRTWIYIEQIASWYDEFNEARNAFFAGRGIGEDSAPASTGIGMPNRAGAALAANVLAIQPASESAAIRTVNSPLQCPAPAYKSSFSRAVETVMSSHRRLYVSGTASIGAGGATAYPGDVRNQLDLTMEVVRNILASRGMDWPDTTRVVAYFKDLDDAPLLDAYCRSRDIPPLPAAIVRADICRDDLLFELELDAVARS